METTATFDLVNLVGLLVQTGPPGHDGRRVIDVRRRIQETLEMLG
jgi:hypothetical protein